MREQVEVFIRWLEAHRASANAHTLLLALARETLKRCDSPDPEQREFDALALAQAAGTDDCSDFDDAKARVDRAAPLKYYGTRVAQAEEYFRQQGQTRAVRPMKRSPGGKHRAQWYLEPYDLPPVASADEPVIPTVDEPPSHQESVRYQQAPPGSVRPAWWARVLFTQGAAVTRSPRGILWAAVLIISLAEILLCLGLFLLFNYAHRPLQTSDLVQVLGLSAYAFMAWRFQIQPLIRLLDDRLIIVGDAWVGIDENPAQLELVKEDGKKVIQLVRYTAVCPICAGTLELRYSQGPNRRRIVGCCDEAPHDHVYSFDRVTRAGYRL